MPDMKFYSRLLQTPRAAVQSVGRRELCNAMPEPALHSKSGYFAASPNGTQVSIPKELFVAFSDFIKTRKCPGSIAIQFRGGEITCVEALSRKTYRNSS